MVFFLFAAALVLVLSGMLSGTPILIFAAIFPLFILLAGLWSLPATPEFQVQLEPKYRVCYAGEELQITGKAVNTGERVRMLTVYYQRPGSRSLEPVYRGENISPGNTVTFTIDLVLTRGRYIVKAPVFQASSFFGLVTRSFRQDAEQEFLVLPEEKYNTGELPLPARLLPRLGNNPSNTGGEGYEFQDIRKYQPGDPFRRIAWKAGKMPDEEFYVRQFREERMGEISLILDTRAPAYTGGSPAQDFEEAAEAGAFLARTAIRAGNRVSLLCYGRILRYIRSGYGKRHLEKLLRLLAAAAPGENSALSDLSRIPERFFAPGASLVFLSPIAQGDEKAFSVFTGHGHTVTVFAPQITDRAGKSGQSAALADDIYTIERSLLRRSAAKAGARIIQWQEPAGFVRAALQGPGFRRSRRKAI
ncbi:MAG: DUF58 domain-containing protein [Spirochaetia bacterium]